MSVKNSLCKETRKSLNGVPSVYIFRNRINNKYYIGETLNLRSRISEYLNIPKKCEKRPIMNAIKSYGLDNFDFEYYNSPNFNKDDLLVLEEEMIKKYDSLSPKGYNICIKGTDCSGVKHSLETRKKMRDYHSKPTYQYDPLTGEFMCEHLSIDNAAKSVNGNTCNISLVASGSRKTAHGYIWKFEKFDKVNPVKRVGITHTQKIYQYSLEGKYLKEFSSVTEAANVVGAKASNLCIVCSGERKSSHGFIWSYKKSASVPPKKKNNTPH